MGRSADDRLARDGAYRPAVGKPPYFSLHSAYTSARPAARSRVAHRAARHPRYKTPPAAAGSADTAAGNLPPASSGAISDHYAAVAVILYFYRVHNSTVKKMRRPPRPKIARGASGGTTARSGRPVRRRRGIEPNRGVGQVASVLPEGERRVRAGVATLAPRPVPSRQRSYAGQLTACADTTHQRRGRLVLALLLNGRPFNAG